MVETYTRFDAADFLRGETDIAHYLEAASEENDAAVMATALGDVARARDMNRLAREAGLTKAGLAKALSAGGNASFATVMKVANALGYTMTFVPLTASEMAGPQDLSKTRP